MIGLVALLVGSLLSTAGLHSTESPSTQQLVQPAVPKLVCKTGSVVFKDGRVRTTGGCTFKGKPVGKWSWVNPTTIDAAGTSCTMAATSGRGSSFDPKPKARVTPVFTLRVPKSRFYRAKVLRVGGRTLIAGWDSCGTPLEVGGQLTDGSKLCRYVTDHSWDLATRTLRLAKVACPAEFGEGKWQLDGKLGGRPDVTIYGGVLRFANGYSALSYAYLNSGCFRANATAVFVIPPSWRGNAYWDITLLTMDANGQPLLVNEIPLGEWGFGDPRFNGFASNQRIGPFTLSGSKPFC